MDVTICLANSMERCSEEAICILTLSSTWEAYIDNVN